MLGAQRAPLDLRRFPHSAITFRVYTDFRERTLMRELFTARFVAFSSILGNSFVDGKKLSGSISDLYSAVYSSIPYVNASSGRSASDSERKDFMEQFWQMRKQLLKQEDGKGDGK